MYVHFYLYVFAFKYTHTPVIWCCPWLCFLLSYAVLFRLNAFVSV